MKEKLIKELNEIYEEYESKLINAINYCGGNNKKSEYKRTTDNFSKSMVRKSNDYEMVNDSEIETLVQKLYDKLIDSHLVD